jgi:hypothetical protein
VQAVVGADGVEEAALLEQTLECGAGVLFARGLQGFAQENEAGGLAGDCQRVTVLAVAEAELAPAAAGAGS